MPVTTISVRAIPVIDIPATSFNFHFAANSVATINIYASLCSATRAIAVHVSSVTISINLSFCSITERSIRVSFFVARAIRVVVCVRAVAFLIALDIRFHAILIYFNLALNLRKRGAKCYERQWTCQYQSESAHT